MNISANVHDAKGSEHLFESLEANYVDDVSAAKLIGSTVGTLRRWRHEGKNLRYYKVGSNVRYKIADLQHFLESRAVEVGG
jgi:excisionase family DNA binding protein